VYNKFGKLSSYTQWIPFVISRSLPPVVLSEEKVIGSRKKSIQALSICIAILERRLNEWYVDRYNVSPNIWNDNILLSCESNLLEVMSVEKRDQQVLWKLIQKYSEYWWT
jgi:hypothetical protein